MEQNYKSNSNASKEKQAAQKDRHVKKVISGNVRTRENKGRKFLGNFIASDADSVWETIFMDVLVPSLKKLVSEGITTAADLFIYGETKGRGKSSDRASYRKYYDERYGDRDRRESERRSTRNRFDYYEIVYETRGEAELVLRHMRETCDEYGLVSVSDLYEFSGESAPFTSHDYGWMSLRTAEVKRVSDGYIIDLPKFMPLR